MADATSAASPKQKGANFRKAGFSVTPWKLMHDAPTNDHWAVFDVIYSHAFASEAGCFASSQTIAAEAKIDKDRLAGIVQWLISEQWLVAHKRPGYTTVYYCRVDHPSGIPDTPTPPENRIPPLGDSGGGYSGKPDTKKEPNKKSPIKTSKPPVSPPCEGGHTPKAKDLKRIEERHVPEDLKFCSALLVDFWNSHKSGARTMQAWNRLQGQLRLIKDASSRDHVTAQIDDAIGASVNGNPWKGIEFRRWQQFAAVYDKKLASAGKVPKPPPPESWPEFDHYGLAVKPSKRDLDNGTTFPKRQPNPYGVLRQLACMEPWIEDGDFLRNNDGSLVCYSATAYASDLTEHYLTTHNINHHANV